MKMRFADLSECSIEFESEDNYEEKQLLRGVYLKLMGLTESERLNWLQTLLNDGDD